MAHFLSISFGICVKCLGGPLHRLIDVYKRQSLYSGDTVRLSAAVYPENATYPEITWSTSDPDIATIDENGVITAIESGTVTLSAKTADGVEATIQLKVASRFLSFLVGCGFVLVVVTVLVCLIFLMKKRLLKKQDADIIPSSKR